MIKPFIGFLLKKVPRTYLQRVSKPIFKLLSAFYNGNNVECPICNKKFRKFFPYGRVYLRNFPDVRIGITILEKFYLHLSSS